MVGNIIYFFTFDTRDLAKKFSLIFYKENLYKVGKNLPTTIILESKGFLSFIPFLIKWLLTIIKGNAYAIS